MTDRFIKNVNLAILFVALSATAILAFLRTLLVDRVIFVMLMISATVAVSTVISLVFFLKFNTKRQKTVMLVSTAVMALSGFIVDFIHAGDIIKQKDKQPLFTQKTARITREEKWILK